MGNGYRVCLLVAVSLLSLVAGTAIAQCQLGVYSDIDGKDSSVNVALLNTFSVFVVMSVEDQVNGVAYQLDVQSLTGTPLVHLSTSYGPGGGGIAVTTPAGGSPISDDLAVGLGLCASGYGGTAILVTEYSFMALAGFVNAKINVLPNSAEDPSYPAYATCQGVVKQCTQTSALSVRHIISSEPISMSAVKTLYN